MSLTSRKGMVIKMKLCYDLHIHSALSPCGDNDMTPNNIVNMSIIKELDVIAVTDHNSCANVRSVIKAADGRITVIPGMEIETSEEIHIVSYFPSIEAAEEMEKIIKKNRIGIKNKTEIYGNQFLMDENDEIIGEEDELLVAPTKLDIYTAVKYIRECGGEAVPAHIDRSSYSVLSNLGFIPEDIDFKTVEITPKGIGEFGQMYNKYNIISNSDAHYLENISEPEFFIDSVSKNVQEIFNFLCKKE